MVSVDTDASIAARQGAAWKISGWTDHIAIHHAKGCACCHEYINHLLGAQSLSQINLLHSNIENTAKSTWPRFINSIEIDADERVQKQSSNLHVQINEMKDAPHDTKKSSKRQQCKGLGPSTFISSFNSIEALEKNYLAQLPSNSLTDPTFH